MRYVRLSLDFLCENMMMLCVMAVGCNIDEEGKREVVLVLL